MTALPTTVWVQILAWKKFNDASSKVKATSWFRMENDWLEHPDFVGLAADQCLLWSYLLGKSSEKLKARGVIYVSIELARVVAKLGTAKRVVETLEYFRSKGLIRLLNDPGEASFTEDAPQPLPTPSEDVPKTLPTRSERVPNVLPTRSERVANAFKSTERDETERNEKPPKAPPTGGQDTDPDPPPQLSKREARAAIRSAAVELVARAVHAAQGDDAEAAAARLGEPGMAIILAKWRTWRAFCTAFGSAARKDALTAFEAQLRDLFAAKLVGALEAAGFSVADLAESGTGPPPEPVYADAEADYTHLEESQCS